MSGLRHLALLVRLLIEDRQRLALENVALRHQLAILKRSVKRAKIQDSDRMFWIPWGPNTRPWPIARDHGHSQPTLPDLPADPVNHIQRCSERAPRV